MWHWNTSLFWKTKKYIYPHNWVKNLPNYYHYLKLLSETIRDKQILICLLGAPATEQSVRWPSLHVFIFIQMVELCLLSDFFGVKIGMSSNTGFIMIELNTRALVEGNALSSNQSTIGNIRGKDRKQLDSAACYPLFIFIQTRNNHIINFPIVSTTLLSEGRTP